MFTARTCPACDAPIASTARYCDQCGQFVSSAGSPTQRLKQLKPENQEWFRIDGYALYIHEINDSVIHDTGTHPQRYVRSVRLNVEYVNESRKPLKYTCLQWLLYDNEGYSYECEIRNQFFEADAPRKLPEGMINPGKRVRGWIAFSPVEHAVLAYVQFRRNYGARTVIDVPLQMT